MQYLVTIEDTGISYACDERESILSGMARLQQKGIPIGCCGGGCGICKVEIIKGTFKSLPMSRVHVSFSEAQQHVVLACRTFPCDHLTLRVIGLMSKSVCRRKLMSELEPMSMLQAWRDLNSR